MSYFLSVTQLPQAANLLDFSLFLSDTQLPHAANLLECSPYCYPVASCGESTGCTVTQLPHAANLLGIYHYQLPHAANLLDLFSLCN